MCVEIFEESKQSYEILIKNIPSLPSSSYIESFIQQNSKEFSESICNLDKLPIIISNFKKQFNINNNTKVYASLAVDALFFKPDVKINQNGVVTGMLSSCNVDEKTYNLFARDLYSFIDFIKNNWSNIIKSGFVFQLNPFSPAYKSVVLHIVPSSNGKANQSIINKLYEIRRILHNYRIEVLSFSFDGENAFKNLNDVYYQTYIYKMLKNNLIPSGRIICVRISPDFLHLMKRFRHRFLTHRIHIIEIRKILSHVPEIVFSDLSITKMHDSLPMNLFSLYNFLLLFDKKKFDATGYFFTVTIAFMAYHMNNLGYHMRHFLFELSLWFLAYYKLKLIQHSNEKVLPERKYKDKRDVVGYSNDLLVEFSNNLFSNINLIEKIDNMDTDRNSTTPLEHTFGRARVKAKDIHTIQKFIKVIERMNQKDYKRSLDELEQIKGRSLSFGVVIENRKEDEIFFSSTPQQIAMEFIELIFHEENSNDFNNSYSFIDYIRDFCEIKMPKTLTLNKITFGTEQTKTIKQRIAFSISHNPEEFNSFLQKEIPNKKINEQFIVQFYQILKENVPLFPSLNEKKETKSNIIEGFPKKKACSIITFFPKTQQK